MHPWMLVETTCVNEFDYYFASMKTEKYNIPHIPEPVHVPENVKMLTVLDYHVWNVNAVQEHT